MKRYVAALAVSTAWAGAAEAQSSVTLYGIIDTGLNYTNNVNGHSLTEVASGHVNGSRWGLRGAEDLGGGNKAIFQLENGFSGDTGAAGQGRRMFGRQAYVGLESTQYGRLTLGRQYDSVVDYFAPATANGNWAGWQFAHPLDNDNSDNSFRLDNTIKYASPNLGGFRFGGAYAFSEDASFSNNRTFSLGASYAAGSLNFGLGYLQADHAGNTPNGALATDDANFTADLTRIIGAGVNYTAGPAILGFAYSTSYFSKPANSGYLGGLTNSAGGPVDSLRYHNFEVNGKYQVTPAIFVGGQYVLSLVKYDAATGNAKPLVHTVGVMANYAFSKRTDIYAQTSYQTVKGGKTGTALDNGYIPSAQGASSTNSQITARVALRHRF
jgi:predicted porin